MSAPNKGRCGELVLALLRRERNIPYVRMSLIGLRVHGIPYHSFH